MTHAATSRSIDITRTKVKRFLRIQHGEGRAFLLLGGVILATEAGYWLGGNGVDGLVFGRFGSGILPYVLMLKGLLAFLAVTLFSRWQVVLSGKNMLLFISACTLLVLAGSRLALGLNPPDWFYFLLWPLCYIVPDLFLVQAWGIAGESFDSRQTKRLFPLISAVGAIGIVSGNFLSYPLAGLLGSANLLLVWVGLVLLATLALITQRLRLDRNNHKSHGRSALEQERVEQAGIWQSLRSGYLVVRYYRIIGLMVICTTLMYLLYYALFKVFVTSVSQEYTRQYPADEAARADAMTGFFGLVGGCSTLLAFVLGLLVVNRLFTRLGVRNLAMVMPLTNLLVFSAVLLFSGFNTVVAARFLHLMLTEAIGSPVNQTIYNLLPQESREAATPFNNQGLSKQGGIVLAGLLLLLSLVSLQLVIVLALLLSGVYVLVAWKMRSLYRPSLVQLLRDGQQTFFDAPENANQPEEEVYSEVYDATIESLRDSNEGTRRLAAEMLGQMGVTAAIRPLIKSVVTDPSSEVRRAAIEALVALKATGALPHIAESLADPESPVRAEAARSLRYLYPRLEYSTLYLLEKNLHDRDPVARREAAITLYTYGHTGQAMVCLWELGRSKEPAARREAAIAYGYLKDPILLRCLYDLMDDFYPEVRQTAAASLREVGGPSSIKLLLANLDDDNPGVRQEVAGSLAAIGGEALPSLLNYLETSSSQTGAACALQALTLAKLEIVRKTRLLKVEQRVKAHHSGSAFPAGDSDSPLTDNAGALILELENESYNNFFELEDVQAKLLAYGQRQLEYAVRVAGYITSLNALNLPKSESAATTRYQGRDRSNLYVMLKSLQERYDSAILRVVSVIGLLGDAEALDLVATGLKAKGHRAARTRADAIETLENFGKSSLTPRLVQLLEGRENLSKPGERTMSEILLKIWQESDVWLQVCVLHLAGLFMLVRLRPLVEQALYLQGETDYLFEETASEALKLLDTTGTTPAMPAQKEGSKALATSDTLTTMSRILLLQKVPIFANLRPEDLRRVALVCKERQYLPESVICYEGDPGDELYIVARGQVQVLTGSGTAHQRLLATNGTGEAVGMMAILDDIPRSATLKAGREGARLLILSADEFKRILQERPEMAAEVIRVLSRMLRETNRRLQDNSDLADTVPLAPR